MASRWAPSPWALQPLSCPPLPTSTHHVWPGWRGAATHRALELQPPAASAHLIQAPPGGEGLSGAGGLLGEALGAPPRHLSLETTMPDRAGRAWSVEPEGSRDAAGTRTLAQQCQACHHQRLLLFPAHFLTDSKVKSKTWTRPWAASRKRNTCGGSMPPTAPGSLLAGHPFHRHSQGTRVPSASHRCVSCCAALHSHRST